MNIAKRQIKRVGVAIVGGFVLLFGLLTIPYPGPGWLIVFAGLAILATEFEWAKHLLHRTKEKYNAWQQWVRRQPMTIRLVVIVLTGIIVVVTLWLLNMFALVDSVLPVNAPWLHSPLGFFAK